MCDDTARLQLGAAAGALLLLHEQTADDADGEAQDGQRYPAAGEVLADDTHLAHGTGAAHMSRLLMLLRLRHLVELLVTGVKQKL